MVSLPLTARPYVVLFFISLQLSAVLTVPLNNDHRSTVHTVFSRRAVLHDRNTKSVLVSKTRFWPPWPFSLLSSGEEDQLESPSKPATKGPTRISLFWSLTGQSARVGINKVRQVGSELWFHLPPATPPFLLLAAIPEKRIIPLISQSFARNVALTGFGLSLVSWAHYELNRKRKLTPLPLAQQYLDLNRAILPPFLPEEQPTLETIDPIAEDDDVLGLESEQPETASLPNSFAKHFYPIRGTNPYDIKATIREWDRLRREKQRTRYNEKRRSIYKDLVSVRSLKKKAKKVKKGVLDMDDMGYALVTGASRGIGRALAVELARYEIPLILVARDIDRLISLACDIEACYGVKCCVLRADLSRGDEAERIFNTTQRAGLKVDVLVNNAGFSKHGSSVDMPLSDVSSMIQVNAVSACTLAHLYGKEMKNRRRGRIMMLSSICGAVSGIPTVAVYAATKAFENTLSLSLAKELEPYGVGVTCVMPGAIRDTSFRERSDTQEALCWKIPFYTRTPANVAEMGVRALLRGDTESTPGWQNRVFLKVMKPALPQRIHSMIAEAAFNPLQLPTFRKRSTTSYNPDTRLQMIEKDESKMKTIPKLPSEQEPAKFDLKNRELPQLLQIDEAELSGEELVGAESTETASDPLDPVEDDPPVRNMPELPGESPNDLPTMDD